jgi:hypothetical protein
LAGEGERFDGEGVQSEKEQQQQERKEFDFHRDAVFSRIRRGMIRRFV